MPNTELPAVQLPIDTEAEAVVAVAFTLAGERAWRSLTTDVISRARELGLSWSRIGDAAGITRQAAWERWGRA